MSRSYRHLPIITDGKRKVTKRMKRYANKTVRQHNAEISNGKEYKKLYCSYNIHDYVCYWPWSKAKQEWKEGKNSWLTENFPTLKQFYLYWKKCQAK